MANSSQDLATRLLRLEQQLLEPSTRGDPTALTSLLAEDIALLIYRSTRTTTLQAATRALRSSLWVHRDNRWQMIFHQGTPI